MLFTSVIPLSKGIYKGTTMYILLSFFSSLEFLVYYLSSMNHLDCCSDSYWNIATIITVYCLEEVIAK